MNYDIDDSLGDCRSSFTKNQQIYSSKDSESASPTIISRLKSLFSQTAESNDYSYAEPNSNNTPISINPRRTSSRLSSGSILNDLHRNLLSTESSTHTHPHDSSPSFLDMGSAPSGPATHRFSDVKRILTNLTIPARHTRIESGGYSATSATTHSGRSVFSHAHSPTSSTFTPPLTPDSFNGLLLSPATFSEYEEHGRYQYRFREEEYSQQQHRQEQPRTSQQPGIHIHEDDLAMHHEHFSRSQDIKEGKKPARPICHAALIADISNTPPVYVPEEAVDLEEDTNEEWYGLEYTLELSRRDRRGSESGEPTSRGEHSKSHESWAAIHQRTVPAVCEDEGYYNWRRWHRYLDKQDERRRKRKALEFMTQAEDLAYIYAEEMRTRDWIRWEKEQEFPNAKNIGYAKEHLHILVGNRPDPYFPAPKHDLAWHLKRYRSLCCIRELSPVLLLGDDERDWLEPISDEANVHEV